MAAVPGSARNRVLRGNSGHRGVALIPAVPGMEFPWGFTAFWGWCSFRSVPAAPGVEFSWGFTDFWERDFLLPVPAAPGIEFSWGFTGPWERGIVYSARFRAKRSFAGGLLMILADSVIFATFRPKPCLAGGFLRIRGFSVILRGSPGAERCARDFSGPRISFSGAGSSSRAPEVPKKSPNVPPEVPEKVENM